MADISLPKNLDLREGLLRFTVAGVKTGGQAMVTVYLTAGSTPHSWRSYGYGRTEEENIDQWYTLTAASPDNEGASLQGSTVIPWLMDGGGGDQGKVADQRISVTGAPAWEAGPHDPDPAAARAAASF